jgi:predicted transcriptional regulator
MQHINDTTAETRTVAFRLPLDMDKRLAKLAIDLNDSKQSLLVEAVGGFVARKEEELEITGGKKHGKAV